MPESAGEASHTATNGVNTPEMAQAERTEGDSADNGKLVAILAYFLVGIVWYFADEKVKGSSLAKFHVKQSLNLMVISVVLHIALSVLMGGMYMLMPIIALLSMLINLAVFVLWIMGIIYAINDEQKPLPIVGEWAAKYLKF